MSRTFSCSVALAVACAALLFCTRSLAQPCGNVTQIGCCVDDNLVKYCSGGVLKSSDCTSKPKCGWDSTKSYYTCGTSGGSDPASTYPRLCSALPDSGPITAADSGTKDGTGIPCGPIPTQGCCEGETVKYCSTSSGFLSSKSCASKPKCGWDSTKKYYTCDTSGTADPAGTYPMPCSALVDGGSADTGGAAQETGVAQDTGGTAQEAGTTPDSGTSRDDSDDGCGCAVGTIPRPAVGLLLLAGLCLLALRRRR